MKNVFKKFKNECNKRVCLYVHMSDLILLIIAFEKV